jgi:hypothetical protein
MPIHDVPFTHFQTHLYDMMIVDMFALAAQDLPHDLSVPMVTGTCSADFAVFDLPEWISREMDPLTEK